MTGADFNVQAVVLAGGSGSRLWPASRRLMPKQFLQLHGDKSLLEETVSRLSPLVDRDKVIIVGGKDQFQGVGYQLTKQFSVLMEPVGRNTAPAIGLAALYGMLEGGDPLQVVLPADHVIRDEARFVELLRIGCEAAEAGSLVTFGIQPEFAATGYGYIKADTTDAVHGALRVQQFVEKPDQQTAEQYLASGEYFWNAGIFMWQCSVILEEIDRCVPEISNILGKIRQAVESGSSWADAIQVHFPDMPDISVDYGVLECSGRVRVIPSDMGWNDVGSWQAVYEIADKDVDANVIRGRAHLLDSRSNLIESSGRLVAGIGLENMCVVETDDAILVSPLDRCQEVKLLVDGLKRDAAPEVEEPSTVRRPWGEYSVLLDSDSYKIKRIVVDPGHRLSLQRHQHRSEHWIVVSGVAEVTRGDETFMVRQNESAFVPQGVKHRLANPGKLPLRMIEVQCGEYVGEDDIERFEDIYGRGE